MAKNRQRDRWAVRKVAAATATPTDEAARLLRARDAIVEAIRVSVAGVDVTQWRPALPPEFGKRKK
jgi:hypothetical protein